MNKLFDMDSGIMQMLTRLADLVILNLLFLITSIPVLTIGAALTAMSYTNLKLKENEGYVVKNYFRSFRENLKQSTLIWMIFLFLLVIFGTDFYVIRSMEGIAGNVIKIGVLVCMLIWMMTFLYVFPLQARFYNGIRHTIVNAFLLTTANFPRTFVMLVISAAAVVATLWNGSTLWFGILVWILLGFSLLSYLNISLMHGIIQKMMPQEEEMQGNEN